MSLWMCFTVPERFDSVKCCLCSATLAKTNAMQILMSFWEGKKKKIWYLYRVTKTDTVFFYVSSSASTFKVSPMCVQKLSLHISTLSDQGLSTSLHFTNGAEECLIPSLSHNALKWNYSISGYFRSRSRINRTLERYYIACTISFCGHSISVHYM